MKRMRKIAMVGALVASPWLLFQSFYAVARQPLDDALIEAVKRNDIAKVEQMLDAGANVNSHDRTRYKSCVGGLSPRTRNTPLIISYWQEVDFDSKSGNFRRKDRSAIRRLLLKRGADVNLGNYDGLTPLHLAIIRNDVKQTDELLMRGADVNTSTSSGETPLEGAVQHGDTNLVKRLIKLGANVNSKDDFSNTPLARCVQYDFRGDKTSLLLKHGANVNTQNKLSETPLHRAVEIGNVVAVKLLLQNGANATVGHSSGQTPLFLLNRYGSRARQNKQKPDVIEKKMAEINSLLRAAGAIS